MLELSSRLGPYEIVASIGAGGMGEVYRARDTRLGRDVAVKVLPEPFANNPDRQSRFEREAKAVAALSHPNILSIHDYGTYEGVTYAVMELLEGETLRSRLKKGPLPWREAVEIGAAIADGLAAAHAKGIIHRDLKPENLFLTADGRVKILDFGLARIALVPTNQSETSPYVPAETEAGTVMGTVGYMSPEQVRGQSADAPSDLFSFGCVMYEMMSGQRAFQRETAAETMTAILHDEPRELTNSGNPIPAELGRLIRQCLAKNPHQRLQSARDLALALRATASNPSFSASTDRRSVEAVAILPFENVGGDPKTEYLSDGIADHLIISLLQVRREGLKVRPFSSVSRYRRQWADVPAIGRELNVQVLVTGTLHQVGDDLWIGVAVVDAHEDNQLWGKRYQGKLSDILDIQDQIARDVAANLRLRLTGEEEQRLTKRYTEDPEAYLLYREAVYHWNKFTLEGLNTAIEYCNRALRRDANYALAFVGLAQCHVLLGNLYVGPRATFGEARRCAERALGIDDRLYEAHTFLGAVYLFHDWNWASAERELKQGAMRSDAHTSSLTLYGFYLAAMGRLPEALDTLRREQEIDLRRPAHRNELAMCHNWLRQYDRAIPEAQKAIDLDANFQFAYAELATAYVQKGMAKDAIAALEAALKRGQLHPRVQGTLGYAYAMAGERAAAQRVLAEMTRLAPDRFAFALPIARIHSALGDKDRAFEWLQKACDERDSYAIWVKVDPTLDNLRSDPRFAQVLREMGLPPDDEISSPAPAARRTLGLLAWMLAGLVLAGLLGTAVYFLTRDRKGAEADRPAVHDQGIHSVAVLPFKNVGGDPKTEFLCSGLPDQIIDSLRQVRRSDLIIRSLTTVSRYKGREIDVPTIALELKVQVIVTGTLEQLGDDLSIFVELVDTRQEDSGLWHHRYKRRVGEILVLQDEIARDVAAHLRLELTGAEEQRLTKHHTEDQEAYRLYREAMYHLNKFNPAELNVAINLCNQAIARDPKYAIAYAALARCYIVKGAIHFGPRQNFPEARKCVAEALKLDPDQADAHAALGAIHLFEDWDWKGAERELSLALRLDPNVMSTRNIYGFCLAAQGRLPEALASIRRGQELDPLAAARRNEVAMCYNWMHQYDQAIAEAQKAIELDPNFVLAYGELGMAYSRLENKHDDAVKALRTAVELGHGHPRMRGLLGYADAMAGQQEEAQKELKALLEDRRFGSAFALARIHAALGQKDEAFKWLQQALDERDSIVIWLKFDPTLDNLRSDPRFALMLKEMKLPP